MVSNDFSYLNSSSCCKTKIVLFPLRYLIICKIENKIPDLYIFSPTRFRTSDMVFGTHKVHKLLNVVKNIFHEKHVFQDDAFFKTLILIENMHLKKRNYISVYKNMPCKSVPKEERCGNFYVEVFVLAGSSRISPNLNLPPGCSPDLLKHEVKLIEQRFNLN